MRISDREMRSGKTDGQTKKRQISTAEDAEEDREWVKSKDVLLLETKVILPQRTQRAQRKT